MSSLMAVTSQADAFKLNAPATNKCKSSCGNRKVSQLRIFWC